MSDQPENTRQPLPPGREQRGVVDQLLAPAALGFGGGVGKAVGEAIVAKVSKPKAPPQDK